MGWDVYTGKPPRISIGTVVSVGVVVCAFMAVAAMLISGHPKHRAPEAMCARCSQYASLLYHANTLAKAARDVVDAPRLDIEVLSKEARKLREAVSVYDIKMDRDLNASLNLKQIYTVSSTEIQACGDGSSEKAISLSPSVKQEFNKKSRVYILKR